jgi:hypothetical protein
MHAAEQTSNSEPMALVEHGDRTSTCGNLLIEGLAQPGATRSEAHLRVPFWVEGGKAGFEPAILRATAFAVVAVGRATWMRNLSAAVGRTIAEFTKYRLHRQFVFLPALP